MKRRILKEEIMNEGAWRIRTKVVKERRTYLYPELTSGCRRATLNVLNFWFDTE